MTNAQTAQEHYTGRRDRNGIAILKDLRPKDYEGRAKDNRQWRPKRRDK